jgi:hypothetical protein
VTARDVDVEVAPPFAPTRRPWLTPTLLGVFTFAITSVAIEHAAERQAPILDSMELQPVTAAASLAYAWGSTADAIALERQVLALSERGGHAAPASTPARGEPNFDVLRRMDADTAKFRLAVLAGAPPATFTELCGNATIRCTPYSLERIVHMFEKQRLVKDAH